MDKNFAVNDYRTFRCVAEYTQDLTVTQTPGLQNNFTFDCIPTLFPQFETNKDRFVEYKIKIGRAHV